MTQKKKKDAPAEEAPEEEEAEEEPEEVIPEDPPKPKPPKKLPKAVDVVYNGQGVITHHSVDRNARDMHGNPIRYIFNPGVPIRVDIPYDIAKFSHLAWISNKADWSVRKPGTDEEITPMETIPYPAHPMED